MSMVMSPLIQPKLYPGLRELESDAGFVQVEPRWRDPGAADWVILSSEAMLLLTRILV